jgi:hypothetical protein
MLVLVPAGKKSPQQGGLKQQGQGQRCRESGLPTHCGTQQQGNVAAMGSIYQIKKALQR